MLTTSAVRLCATFLLAIPAWAQTFQRANGTAADEQAEWIQRTSDGGFVVVGSRTSPAQGSEIYLQKLGPGGELQWARVIAGSGSERGWRVRVLSDGGYLVAGQTSSGSVQGGLLV